MQKDVDNLDMSELEREVELEMEEEPINEKELDEEYDEFAELEGEEPEEEYEEPEEEFEEVEEESTGDYAERLYEISRKEYESESEVDDAVNEVLNEMERDYFFGSLKKRWKRFKRRGLGRLLRKGLKFAAGKIPALKALKNVTDAARAAMRGDLKGLIKAGLGAALRAHPAGAALSPALGALGFEAGEDNREAWNNVDNVARETYEYLLSNLNENADDPLVASRLANEAFRAGLQKVKGSGSFIKFKRKMYRVRVRQGERVLIKIDGV